MARCSSIAIGSTAGMLRDVVLVLEVARIVQRHPGYVSIVPVGGDFLVGSVATFHLSDPPSAPSRPRVRPHFGYHGL